MNVIQQVFEAKNLIQFKTMESSEGRFGVEDNSKSSRIFNGIGFGVNIFLRSHTDMEFTQSIVQVHTDNPLYRSDDPVICYFCFPIIGMAVALRPGDYLLFNATEPHALSSCCLHSDDVYSLSCYLKTSIVGLNDNTIPFNQY
jgi:hypothetical protein